MKVLYGVQATGNGHITRARVMAPALQQAGVEVDYLFSGRPADELFDMTPFGDYQVRQGLTFYMGEGARVLYAKTALNNNLLRLWKDVKTLDLSPYDLVISDFEPVTAWAAKRQKKRSVGIAHQYAFLHPLPDGVKSRLLKPGIQIFAPVSDAIGIHWHHFDHPIVPPLIQPPRFVASQGESMVLVYLPYETDETLCDWFSPFYDYEFRVFKRCSGPYQIGNVHFHPLSRDNFEKSLAVCSGVISNCGFGLASETMQYGKKFLSKPMQGQTEQQSNADILENLNLATISRRLDAEAVAAWLVKPGPEARVFPDTATALASWVAAGCVESLEQVVQDIWRS